MQDACGIVLGDSKQYLVTSRVSRIMREHDITDLGELIRRMQRTPLSGLKEAVIDAMTTNETLWFRDIHPFEIFKKRVLPEVLPEGIGPLKIWCAACSSGQEPFSLSMSVEEYRSANMGVLKREVDILGTDLSKTVLEQCKKAEYEPLALGRGLSEERKRRFFVHRNDGIWAVKPEIVRRVRFRQFNLLDNFASLGRFDIVFCRNVLIYFSSEQKTDILRRIHGVLRPGGYLFLGASESLNDAANLFEMVHCSPGIIYRAKGK